MLQDKIQTRAGLLDILAGERPEVLGFTSGSFDLLHPGHVDYLEKARARCDCLVVAVNSDSSVRGYKSELRPIMPQEARARVVAGLGSVDYVFIFDELNNHENITLLNPDIYFKASQYTKAQLSSAKLVKEVCLIDIVEHYSTTGIVDSILEKYVASKHSYIPQEPLSETKALILDRDGTINVHRDYLYDPDDFELLPGAIEGIKAFQDAGYKIVVITNQPGIDLGYFEMEKLFRVNKRMLSLLSKAGIKIDKIYFSPYGKAAGTDCRKPGLALIRRAQQELNLNLEDSIVIGDSTSDIKMGKDAGCRTVLVQTGNAGADGLFEVGADYNLSDLKQASLTIL